MVKPINQKEISYFGVGDSELVIALVGAVGTDIRQVTQLLSDGLKHYQYTNEIIKVSKHIIPELISPESAKGEYKRISALMDAGNEARNRSGDNSVLALGIAAKIGEIRKLKSQVDDSSDLPILKRNAFLIDSLKHPDEVKRLRQIYANGFYLLGVYADKERRTKFLEDKEISSKDSKSLIDRDENENLPYGQRTSDTYHLSDFFVQYDGNIDKLKNSINRILELIFGNPYLTPTFDEYAMFMAYSASLRSADLARQVGSIIAKDDEIIATGANDCPKFGGGLYMPQRTDEFEINDIKDGRDYTRGCDSNTIEKEKLIEEIVCIINSDKTEKDIIRKQLHTLSINDITEYGRVVHAEMEALLSCARGNTSSKGATLYCTTFPCHNCAKRIIASGIIRVVYIEPYPKSKAAIFHSDSISLGFYKHGSDRVFFEPFVGVGPRKFIDLFSMTLGDGYPLKRKHKNGKTISWTEAEAKARIQMLPITYIDHEVLAADKINSFLKGENDERKEAN